MTKLVQNDIASLVNEQSALAALNANYASLEAFSDSVLSRDGTSPNPMLADLDMNSNQILNIGDPLDMNGNRIIGLDPGLLDSEPATVGQLNSAILSGGGAPSTVAYITVGNTPSLPAERALAVTGAGLSLTDGGGNASITIDLDDDLDAIAGLSGTGLSARTGTSTWATRTLQPPAAGITITNPAGIAGDPTLVLANDLAALEGLSGTGIAVHTGTSTWTERSLTAPAAGITITNNTGVAGNPTLVLANDLNAVENLASNGMAARTATDTWTTRTITGTANEITSTNGDGVSGNPTLSIPSSVTFTGKTITGGTYSSPALTTPSLGTPTSGTLTSTGGYTEAFVVACSDETTALTTGVNKVKWRMPYAFNVVTVRASLSTAQASGSIFTVDINESGTSIISTKLTIDNTESTSTTAATPAVISDSSLADDAEMSVDIDQIGDGTAKGLKIELIGFHN